MAASIRDFVAGKIRRSETADRLAFDTEGALADPELGAPEGRLSSPEGALVFHSEGLRLEGGASARYDAIARVELSPATDGRRTLDLRLTDGRTLRVHASDAGGLVLHATLRWIGNALLHRKIAD